ncbi:MAG TPA: glycosyltransferase family 39 protein [Candidatus Limnocylindria bacterium]|nr:glycosyltransferase family 39 protein [Candidatus Limnocylindria bacterium]
MTYRRAAWAVVLLAAALRFWGLGNGLPHPLTRPDEEVLLHHLVGPARGDFDLRYAVYPSLYFYVMWAWCALVLRAGALAGLVTPQPLAVVLADRPEHVLLVARALSALVGTLTVAVMLRLTRTTMGRGAALLAGALLATNLLHVRDAHAAKPDALLTLGVAVALLVMARVAAGATVAGVLACGAAIGLATGIKYPALLLLAPAWVAVAAGSDRRGWRRWLDVRLAAVGGAAALAFVATSPYLLLNPETRRAVLGVFGSIFPSLFPSLVPAALPPALFEMTPERAWWSGFAYHVGVSLRYGIGWLPLLLAVPALVWGWRSPRPMARVAVAWIAVYFVVHGLSPMLLSRYMTPLLPALFLLEAGLAAAVLARATRWRALAATAATLALVGPPLVQSLAYDRVMARTDTRVLATEWLAAHAEPGTRVLVAGTVFWGYGEPLMPPGVEKLRPEPGMTALPPGVRFVVGHDHPTFASRFDPAALGALGDRLRLVLDLDPFVGPRDAARFEEFDAYYVPLAGFSAVERTGPRIRIYAVAG